MAAHREDVTTVVVAKPEQQEHALAEEAKTYRGAFSRVVWRSTENAGLVWPELWRADHS